MRVDIKDINVKWTLEMSGQKIEHRVYENIFGAQIWPYHFTTHKNKVNLSKKLLGIYCKANTHFFTLEKSVRFHYVCHKKDHKI